MTDKPQDIRTVTNLPKIDKGLVARCKEIAKKAPKEARVISNKYMDKDDYIKKLTGGGR